MDKPKTDEDEPEIDPALKEKPPAAMTPAPPVGQTGQRRENETDANRTSDGARKRAEEGL